MSPLIKRINDEHTARRRSQIAEIADHAVFVVCVLLLAAWAVTLVMEVVLL